MIFFYCVIQKKRVFLNIRLHRWKASQIWLNACMCKMWSHKNIKHYMIGNGNWSIKEENKQLFNFSFIFFLLVYLNISLITKKKPKKSYLTLCRQLVTGFDFYFFFLFTFDYSFRSRLYSFFFCVKYNFSLSINWFFLCVCSAI